jgi:hypothetical protein
MTDLIPTKEQYNQWKSDWSAIRVDKRGGIWHYLVIRAAQWGADQELEACCEWVRSQHHSDTWPNRIRIARRPKPPSEADQALAALEADPKDGAMIMIDSEQFSIIHRALERLKKLEQLND